MKGEEDADAQSKQLEGQRLADTSCRSTPAAFSRSLDGRLGRGRPGLIQLQEQPLRLVDFMPKLVQRVLQLRLPDTLGCSSGGGLGRTTLSALRREFVRRRFQDHVLYHL